MKRMIKKSASQKGETLVETLVSVLIIALSVTLLVVMLQTASKLNRRATMFDDGLYSALTAAENRTDEGYLDTGELVITVTDEDGTARPRTYYVKFYGKDGILASFERN